jgi:hypothetical protein
VKLDKVPAGQGVGALLPGGQNAPGGQSEHALEPVLLAVAKVPPAQDEGGMGAAMEGGVGVAGAGDGLGEEGTCHIKVQPWGHHTMGHALVSRP